MKLAKDEALANWLELEVLSKALEKDGFGNLGTQAWIKHYKK